MRRLKAWLHRTFGKPGADELPPLPHNLDDPEIKKIINDLNKR